MQLDEISCLQLLINLILDKDFVLYCNIYAKYRNPERGDLIITLLEMFRNLKRVVQCLNESLTSLLND